MSAGGGQVGFDHSTMAQAFAGPGMDTRLWVTYATVAPSTDDSPSVLFKDENGKDLPYPIVIVTFSNGMLCPCRVSNSCAGDGEGEWYPFVPGDEVLVLVPEGDEREGCTIVGRLNQNFDKFPLSVAGMDASANTFGFRRMRAPYIVETAAGYMIRQATTGAALTIDPLGAILINNGDKHLLALSADAISLQLSDGSSAVQITPSDGRVIAVSGGTALFLDDANGMAIQTGGTVNIGTGGSQASGHGVTLEQIVSILANFILGIQASVGWNPAGALAIALATPGAAAAVTAVLTVALNGAAATTVPFAASGPTPGGELTATGLSAIVAGALATSGAVPDPASLGLPLFAPGVGRAGFMI